MEAARQRKAVRHHGIRRPVPDGDVGSGTRLQAADLMVQIQGLRRTQGDGMQGTPGRQALPQESLHLIGSREVAQQVQAGTSPHVAGHGHPHTGLSGQSPVEQATAEKEVGCGAVRDGGANIAQLRAVLIIEPDPMGQHRSSVQEAIATVHVQVAARPREQFPNPLNFGLVLRHVGLQVETGVFAQQRTGHGQLRLRRRRRKARRDRISATA